MSEDKPTKYSSVELEYYELYEQNRILKQNNILLSMKEEELKRQMNKYKDAVIQGDCIKIKENIINSEVNSRKLHNKLKQLQEEIKLTDKKIELLECLITGRKKFEDIFDEDDKIIFKCLNDMTIKNIDRIEKINEENRLLLKELINLGFDIKS